MNLVTVGACESYSVHVAHPDGYAHANTFKASAHDLEKIAIITKYSSTLYIGMTIV